MLCLSQVCIFASDTKKTVNFYRLMFSEHVVFDAKLVGQRDVRPEIGGLVLHTYD